MLNVTLGSLVKTAPWLMLMVGNSQAGVGSGVGVGPGVGVGVGVPAGGAAARKPGWS